MSKHLAVVLAAGKGTRMESELPKVLVPVCGRPMIEYVLAALRAGGIDDILVVVGYRSELVRRQLAEERGVSFVEQTQQLGTGHAVMMCREQLADHDGAVLVVTGDSPLIQVDSIRSLLERFEAERPACIIGTAHKDDPTGLGRVVRDENRRFKSIVEEKDASELERKITEVNMSTYVFNCRDLREALAKLTTDNAQGEYYITDCPRILQDAGKAVLALDVLKPCEALSINTLNELAVVEGEMRRLGIA